MIGSILIKMPELTKDFDDEIGVEVINKYFVRLKGDIYIPIFNLPLLYPGNFFQAGGYRILIKLADITFEYYKKYIKLRKHKQFKLDVFLPEKYGGNALYYLLQKFMIGEATPEEIKIISEFLSRDIFDGKHVRMDELLKRYCHSIWELSKPASLYSEYEKTIFINTPVGATPLYVSDTFLNPSSRILITDLENYMSVAFVNVLASYFFGKSIQIGSLKFNLLKSIGELDFNWKNVKLISFRELYDISDAIIENNLERTRPSTIGGFREENYFKSGLFLSYSPILSAVGSAIDFKNKSVMFLFAILKSKNEYTDLSDYNNKVWLNNKNVEFFVTSVPLKNIKKFIYRIGDYTGIFIIEQGGKVIPMLSLRVGSYWIGIGKENIVKHYKDYEWWYGLLRRLASPEHLKKAEEKTLEWLKNIGYL